MGYYCPDEKLLLSCETIGVFNGTDDVVPSYLVGYDMTISSIEKLRNFEIENILVPHYGLLSKTETEFYLKKAKESAVDTAGEIIAMLKNGQDKEEIFKYFKDKFYFGYTKEIYPLDAMELNTGIMIDMLKKEFD